MPRCSSAEILPQSCSVTNSAQPSLPTGVANLGEPPGEASLSKENPWSNAGECCALTVRVTCCGLIASQADDEVEGEDEGVAVERETLCVTGDAPGVAWWRGTALMHA